MSIVEWPQLTRYLSRSWWCPRQESNPRPSVHKTVALPAELQGQPSGDAVAANGRPVKRKTPPLPAPPEPTATAASAADPPSALKSLRARRRRCRSRRPASRPRPVQNRARSGGAERVGRADGRCPCANRRSSGPRRRRWHRSACRRCRRSPARAVAAVGRLDVDPRRPFDHEVRLGHHHGDPESRPRQRLAIGAMADADPLRIDLRPICDGAAMAAAIDFPCASALLPPQGGECAPPFNPVARISPRPKRWTSPTELRFRVLRNRRRPRGPADLAARYGETPVAEAEVVVALGGDGLLLQTLHRRMGTGKPSTA